MTDLTITSMYNQAKATSERAYAPYSHFKVGCCIRTTNDRFFTGCNVENVSYGLTQCAEAVAIANMVSCGVHEIAEVVVMAEAEMAAIPCGACRQRLVEFAKPSTLIHLGNRDKILRTVKLNEIIPDAFSANYMK